MIFQTQNVDKNKGDYYNYRISVFEYLIVTAFSQNLFGEVGSTSIE